MILAVLVLFLISIVLTIVGIVRLAHRRWVSGGILLGLGLLLGVITIAIFCTVLVYG